MSNKKQRKSLVAQMEVDRISSLPGHVIDKILSRLSIREAVRTTILSSDWRYKWASLPCLVFDNESGLASSQDQSIIKNQIVNTVDRVLLLHTGPIHEFRLSHRDLQGVSDIDRWILFLSRASVKKFILEIWKGERYKLPSSIYLCRKLIHLELFNCLLKSPPPPVFNGFRSLKSLDLQRITMEQGAFEHLICSCPVLERLTLINFEGFNRLKIHAPTLLFFDVGGVFEDVSFQDTAHLATVSIALYLNAEYERNFAITSHNILIKVFAHLPSIKRLEVQEFFWKYLSAGKIPRRLPAPCVDLSFLSLSINFCNMKERLAALCLLRSSPNLQELEMRARSEELAILRSVASITEEDYQSCAFHQLRLVKIVDISGLRRHELNFISFLLANSPILEKMTVKPAPKNSEWGVQKGFVKQLLSFRRASADAEIIYLDP